MADHGSARDGSGSKNSSAPSKNSLAPSKNSSAPSKGGAPSSKEEKGEHSGCCNPPMPGDAAKKYMTQGCKLCPPCHAPCNPGAPPTQAELDVARLTLTLAQTQDGFKQKITECALLRADVQECREIAERERANTRETVARLREVENRFDALSEHAHALLRNKEQTIGQEPAVRALKLCYRETRDEANELRVLLEEQNVQLQDYRAKYQAAQQLVEEQKKQMAALDLDNARIADQINLQIHSIKVQFQQRLAELGPLPDVLVATQRKLNEAHTAKALAEHAAANTADELDQARERVHMLINLTKNKPLEKPAERTVDDRMLPVVQQRVTQLTEMSAALRGEIERQKVNTQRLEDAVMACEKRLQEKMHECAALGGELDRTREEAQRAVLRAHQHHDTVHKCMDATLADLQFQLAQTKRQIDVIEKDKASTRCRLMCQLNRLQDKFDTAQLRVLGLQTQVDAMRQRGPGAGADADAAADGEGGCACLAIDA